MHVDYNKRDNLSKNSLHELEEIEFKIFGDLSLRSVQTGAMTTELTKIGEY